MQLTINNEAQEFPEGMTVRNLLDSLGLTGQYVAVERNRRIVPYQTFGQVVLEDKDTLEVVTLVGGG